jgi:hypothetical protein
MDIAGSQNTHCVPSELFFLRWDLAVCGKVTSVTLESNDARGMWEDNIKIDHKTVRGGDLDWIDVYKEQ